MNIVLMLVMMLSALKPVYAAEITGGTDTGRIAMGWNLSVATHRSSDLKQSVPYTQTFRTLGDCIKHCLGLSERPYLLPAQKFLFSSFNDGGQNPYIVAELNATHRNFFKAPSGTDPPDYLLCLKSYTGASSLYQRNLRIRI